MSSSTLSPLSPTQLIPSSSPLSDTPTVSDINEQLSVMSTEETNNGAERAEPSSESSSSEDNNIMDLDQEDKSLDTNEPTKIGHLNKTNDAETPKRRYRKDRSLENYYKNKMFEAQAEVEALKNKNKPVVNTEKVNNKKLEDWKGKPIEPYSTDMAFHCQTVERKINEHGGVPEDRMSTYLLSSLEANFKTNVEGSYPGNINRIKYSWIKNELVTKYSKMGIITDNTESYEEKLAGITMKPDETLMDVIARINTQRNLFKKSKDGDNLIMLQKMDAAALTILKSRAGDKIQKEVNMVKRKWKSNELRMTNPESDWISLYNHFLVNDPLEGKRLDGGSPKSKNKDEKKSDQECRYGIKCKKQDTCRFKHSTYSNNNKRKRTDNVPEKNPKKIRPSIAMCDKCGHKHPVEGGCESCWKCHPEKAPARANNQSGRA